MENRKEDDIFLLRRSKGDASPILWGIQQMHIVTGRYYPWMEKINKAILQIEVQILKINLLRSIFEIS